MSKCREGGGDLRRKYPISQEPGIGKRGRGGIEGEKKEPSRNVIFLFSPQSKRKSEE